MNYYTQLQMLTGLGIGAVLIDEGMEERANRFAQEANSAGFYCAYRAAPSPQTVIKNVYFGKLGEEVVYKLFTDFGLDCKEVDYEHYGVKGKTWSADTFLGENGLQVKTCSAWNGEYSWVFQKSQQSKKAGTDPLFADGSSKDWMAFVQLGNTKTGKLGGVVSFLNWVQVKDLFEPPRLANKKTLKACIYLNTLKRLYPVRRIDKNIFSGCTGGQLLECTKP